MAVSARVAAERQRRYEDRMAAAATVIPRGHYCYSTTGEWREVEGRDGRTHLILPTRACPFWKTNGMKREQENGYCRLLKAGDWMPAPHGTWLLWDQVKECGINLPGDEHEVVDPRP